MDNDGWVKLYKKATESSIFENPHYWRIWCWILVSANYKETKFPFNGTDMVLEPGQFITGREKACSQIKGLTPQVWRSAIKYLKSTNRITIKTTNKFSIITIQKWERYQQNNQQNNQPVTSQQPASNHIIEYKNIKNVCMERPHTSMKYLLNIPQEDMEMLSKGLIVSEDQIRDKGEDLHNFCKAKGKVYKDYRAFLRNMLRRDYPKDTRRFI